MAPLSRLLLAVALLHAAAAAADGGRPTRYDRVFSFGDSLTDTGNALHLSATGGGPASRPPYGETFFRRPTGRASDGRLVVDFIVEALSVPHPTPYLAAGKTAADFRRGVNFAVGGATALDLHFFGSRGLTPFVPVSLSNQTGWFKNVLQLLGSVEEQREITSTSLFLVGEIGVNDYFIAALGRNRTAGDAKTFVPRVVAAVRSVVADVIAAGARTVVVPGMIPLGCEPQLLARYAGAAVDAGGYDQESGCLRRLNDLAELHNRELRRALTGLRRAHPGTAVVYADLYRAVTDLVVSPARYGFRSRPLAACCGGGGPYNFNLTTFCGMPGSTTCADPSRSISWDGIHFTEAANRIIARAVLRQLRRAERRAIAVAGVCRPSAPLASLAAAE